MKMSEIKELSTDELLKKEKELREDGMRYRFKLATGELEDTSVIKKSKKDVARIKMVLAERNLQANA